MPDKPADYRAEIIDARDFDRMHSSRGWMTKAFFTGPRCRGRHTEETNIIAGRVGGKGTWLVVKHQSKYAGWMIIYERTRPCSLYNPSLVLRPSAALTDPRALNRTPLAPKQGSLHPQSDVLEMANAEDKGLSYRPCLRHVQESTSSLMKEHRRVPCGVFTASNLDCLWCRRGTARHASSILLVKLHS